MKLPFMFTKQAFTTFGNDRKIAKIQFNAPSEYDAEIEILKLEYPTELMQELALFKLKKLDIDKKYNKIDDFTFELETTKIMNKDKSFEEQKCAELLIMQKHDKIELMEFHKQFNEARKKPFVALKTNYDESNDPDNMEIEVVYNNTFVEHLQKKGLPGNTPDELVEQWLKLFFISNLDQEDLAMISDDSMEVDHLRNTPSVSRDKIELEETPSFIVG